MAKSSRQELRRQGMKARGKADFYRKIMSADGVEFTFIVHRNRVTVEFNDQRKRKRRDTAPSDPASDPALDWSKALTEKQKIHVFANILDEYRKHTMGDEHGYHGAALGISGDQIFLGANTPSAQLSSPFFKICAEQNMINGASDFAAYEHYRTKGWDTKEKPHAPEFDELYMMGGVRQDHIPISCPCGMCTDMLAKNMVRGGKIYALPILDDPANSDATRKQLKPEQISKDYIRIVTSDENGGDTGKPVPALNEDLHRPNGHYTVWQTRIDHLNKNREVELKPSVGKPDIKKVQENGFIALIDRVFGIEGSLEERADFEHKALLRKATNNKANKKLQVLNFPDLIGALVTHIRDGFSVVEAQLLRRVLTEAAKPIRMAAENEFLERPSIAKLDSAVAANGEVDLGVINHYLLGQITHTLTDRIRGRGKGNPGDKSQWIKDNVTSIRCVVAQLDDGTFRSAVEANTAFDTSMPNAEAVVAVEAVPALGRYGIRHVWVMELNPALVEKGVLPTSPKEGIERLMKRSSKEIDFTYLPFNAGKNSNKFYKDIAEIAFPFKPHEIFPSAFKGSRPGDEPMAIPKPRPWVAYYEQTGKPKLQAALVAARV